jgi:hypothetical protein
VAKESLFIVFIQLRYFAPSIMNKSWFSLLVAMGIYLPVKAQTDYLVTLKGDTLYGQVYCLKQGTVQRIEYRQGRKKQFFTPVQVRALRSKGEDYFPVRTANEYQIMKKLKDGYLSLFAFQPESQVTWDGLYLLKKDGQGMEFSGLLFKKRMSNFLSDCPEVSIQIEGKELRRNDLEQIIDLYNHCIEQKTLTQKKAVAYVQRWEQLEQHVKALPYFEGQGDALDMIKEIRNKVDNRQPVPRFLRDNLRTLLKPYPEAEALLEQLLQQLQP